MSSCLRDIAL